MRFWDSSALVPLLVEEERSVACRRLYRADAEIVVWALTRIEIVSAIRRKERVKDLAARQVASAIHRLDLLAKHWREVDASSLVYDRAERLLAAHPLHASDSLQLAAALVRVQDRPRGRRFVTADVALGEAAAREGFSLDSLV